MSTLCTNCGACCACFRVAFHWSEPVPAELTVKIDPHRLAMRGTEGAQPIRCVALQGEVGRVVLCTVYEQRPSPCRELMPDGQDGVANEQCRRARAQFGLPPLELSQLSSPDAGL